MQPHLDNGQQQQQQQTQLGKGSCNRRSRAAGAVEMVGNHLHGVGRPELEHKLQQLADRTQHRRILRGCCCGVCGVGGCGEGAVVKTGERADDCSNTRSGPPTHPPTLCVSQHPPQRADPLAFGLVGDQPQPVELQARPNQPMMGSALRGILAPLALLAVVQLHYSSPRTQAVPRAAAHAPRKLNTQAAIELRDKVVPCRSFLSSSLLTTLPAGGRKTGALPGAC